MGSELEMTQPAGGLSLSNGECTTIVDIVSWSGNSDWWVVEFNLYGQMCSNVRGAFQDGVGAKKCDLSKSDGLIRFDIDSVAGDGAASIHMNSGDCHISWFYH